MTVVRIPAVPILISDVEPSIPASSGFLPSDWKWFNTSNQRWYDYDGGWELQGAEPTEYAPVDHTHTDLETLVTLITSGITGTRTVGGYTITFNHGILTGFEEA